MATIILLASDHNCTNAGAAAFYLANAFGDHQIKLFNYLNHHLYDYGLQFRTFTDQGLMVANHALSAGVRQTFALANNALAVGAQTFSRLGKVTRYADAMTTLDPTRLPEELRGHADSIIGALLGEGVGPVCFVIAPNGRNLPSRLLTFGHKLSHGISNYTYRRRGHGNVGAPNLLNMTNDQVLATMIEILLCRAIVTLGNARYLGNCYGAQVMWVALGGGLTTYKRTGGNHGQNMIWAYGEQDEYHPEVSWDDGIFLGNDDDDDHPEAAVDRYTLFGEHGAGITYNTDFHHSYMMIQSKATASISVLDHDLREGVINYELGNAPQPHLARMRRYAQSSTERYGDQDPKRNRSWSWVGVYQEDGRIFGFQGHPIYHITRYSAAWNGNTSVEDNDDTAENQRYVATRAMVLRCLFG